MSVLAEQRMSLKWWMSDPHYIALRELIIEALCQESPLATVENQLSGTVSIPSASISRDSQSQISLTAEANNWSGMKTPKVTDLDARNPPAPDTSDFSHGSRVIPLFGR